jgi:hypothetical protein
LMVMRVMLQDGGYETGTFAMWYRAVDEVMIDYGSATRNVEHQRVRRGAKSILIFCVLELVSEFAVR